VARLHSHEPALVTSFARFSAAAVPPDTQGSPCAVAQVGSHAACQPQTCATMLTLRGVQCALACHISGSKVCCCQQLCTQAVLRRLQQQPTVHLGLCHQQQRSAVSAGSLATPAQGSPATNGATAVLAAAPANTRGALSAIAPAQPSQTTDVRQGVIPSRAVLELPGRELPSRADARGKQHATRLRVFSGTANMVSLLKQEGLWALEGWSRLLS
jgi:hypothetical protein